MSEVYSNTSEKQPWTEPCSYTLTVPIIGHGGKTTRLTIKPPCARSFLKGMPFVVEEITSEDGVFGFRTIYNPKVCLSFLADMTGIDEITLEDLHASDVLPLFRIIGNYTFGRPPISET